MTGAEKLRRKYLAEAKVTKPHPYVHLSEEEALERLWSQAKAHAQSSVISNIHIPAEKFFDSAVKIYRREKAAYDASLRQQEDNSSNESP